MIKSIFRALLSFCTKLGEIAVLKQLVDEKQVPVDTTTDNVGR